MLALLAAVVFFIEMVFKPHAGISLTVLGLFLLALHLAVGEVTTLWRRRP